MSLVQEVKEFVMRGNVVDLAVGIIIGGGFNKIVTSVVNDVMMPPVGKLLGNVDFTNLFISLDPQKTEGITLLAKAKETGAALISYGVFLNTVIDFLIVALSVFFMVKAINKLKRPVPDAPAAPSTRDCPFCISAIPLAATRCPHCTSEIAP